MGIRLPWQPKSDRLVELFQRWAADQFCLVQRSILSSRVLRCWNCSTSIRLPEAQLWLCGGCLASLEKQDVPPAKPQSRTVVPETGMDSSRKMSLARKKSVPMCGGMPRPEYARRLWVIIKGLGPDATNRQIADAAAKNGMAEPARNTIYRIRKQVFGNHSRMGNSMTGKPGGVKGS